MSIKDITFSDVRAKIKNLLQQHDKKPIIEKQLLSKKIDNASYHYKKTPSYWSFIKSYNRSFLPGLLFSLLFTVCIFIVPELTKLFLSVLIGNQDSQLEYSPLQILLGLISASFLSWFFLNHTFDKSFEFSLKVRIGITRQLLRLKIHDNTEKKGELISIFSHDIPKIQSGSEALLLLLLITFSIMVSCILLVTFLGWHCLFGIAILFLIQLLLNRQNKKLKNTAKKVARKSTDRSILDRFLIQNLKSVFMQGWNKAILDKISLKRTQETRALSALNTITATINLLFLSSPIIIAFSCLIPVFLFSQNFTVENVFPSRETSICCGLA